MWKDEDTVLFRDYNAKAKGKLISFLKEQTPVLLGRSIQEVALEAKFKEGFERAIKLIEEIVAYKEDTNDGGTKHAQM